MVAKAAGEVEVRRSEASPVRLTLQRRDMLSMAVKVVYRRLTEKGMDRAAEAVPLCQDCRARKVLEGLA